MQKIYFHVDLDSFFASVEQLDHPEYRNKPVVVGGLPGDRRAVVSTASYEARKYGIHSAMPLSKAVQLCPHAIFLRGRHKRYLELSSTIMTILSHYSPDVIQMSIDEAFLDMTGTERLFGSPEQAALKIKQDVKESTGLTISIGIAGTMYVAKIASGYRKPDGMTYIKNGEEEKFMLSLPLEKIWGLGNKTLLRIVHSGIKTPSDIHDKSINYLTTLFGETTGLFLYNAVRGNKNLKFGEEAKNHSISAERTFEYDLTDRYIIETALLEIIQTVSYRMYKENVCTNTVALKIRYEDFSTVSIQETTSFPVKNADTMFEICKRLLDKKYTSGMGIRLLGVACENVKDNSNFMQETLFSFEEEKQTKVESAIFKLKDRHPELKIQRARLLDKKQTSTKHP